MVFWKEVIGYMLFLIIIVIIWGGVVYYFILIFFWWLLFILVGFILVVLIVCYLSSIGLGVKMCKMGLFLCLSEVENDDILVVFCVY